MKKKIVLLDRPRENPGEIDWSPLHKLGDLTMYSETPPELIIERIGDAHIVLVNKTKITREIINLCPNLEYISVIATGYNKINIAAAQERGILVSNVPGYGSEAIAQHALALLLEITNRVAYHDTEVRKGRRGESGDWSFWDYPIMELANKTMGIVGLGRIGKITSQMARAFGMNILANDLNQDLSWENENCRYVSLEELLKNSDIIVLHCPLLPETEGFINRNTISLMKDGVIIINNSRGELICEKDLADALNSGKVYAAGLDTVEIEPIQADSPLLKAKNCFITPYISWAAIECRRRLIDTAIDNIRKYLEGSPVNVVNHINN